MKHIYFSLLLSFITIVSAKSAEIQPIPIKVIDTDNNTPIPYCYIRLKNHPIGTMTDDSGKALIKVFEEFKTDSLEFSSIGYETVYIPYNNIIQRGDSIEIRIHKQIYSLPEVLIIPKETKSIQKGKKRQSGLTMQAYHERQGATYGFEINGKNKRTWLEAFGFFCKEAPDMMSSMKFRINIYDASNVKGKETKAFISYQNEPIYVDYSKAQIIDGKFRYTFPDPIILPQKAMVEIEFLEDMKKDEYIFSKGNILGGWLWTGNTKKREWIKIPISSPFFIECAQEK